MSVTPTFARVARKIGDCRLEKTLQQLAGNVETEIHNAGFVPKRANVRAEIKQLKAKTLSFEIALNRVSKRLLDLPLDASECLPAARQAMREITTLCDKTLSIIPAKGGVAKKPGRVTCALIVIEAWTFATGLTPGANNKAVQEICNDYWRACGGQPIGEDDPGNWRRSMTDALSNQGALRRYIRNELRLCTE
jgi:hypothetical protein